MTFRKNPSFLVAALFLVFTAPARAETLSYGKYYGTIRMQGHAEAIAVSLDAFVTQIKDPTVYPALDVIVRAGLGGFAGSEYVGFHYYDPTFNFEKGVLQLNDPKEDLSATLQVTNTETQTILEGPVASRLSNTKGTMRVVLELDDSVAPAMPGGAFAAPLKGEYEGKCGADAADLQVETARGLGAEVTGNALAGYSITGRLGFTNGPLCAPLKGNTYCSLYPYSAGTFSPFTGRLTLQGPRGTLECTRTGEALDCTVFGYDKAGPCKLSRKPVAPSAPRQAPASIALEVSPAQRAPLPQPNPPGNEEILAALGGDFYGFLHHEGRDAYQPMEMGIVATTSTENLHVQNQVMVEPTILLRLGASWDTAPALSLRYPQRVFWLSPGFAFEAEDGDYFAVISAWRAGYVSGVLYSRTYGRVGTFELVKGARPAIPAGMPMLPSPAGSFKGPTEPVPMRDYWSLSLQLPVQDSAPDHSSVALVGRYSGPGQMLMFDASSLDLNTGTVGFLIRKPFGDRIVAGEMAGRNLRLVWPVGPALGAPMADYRAFTYGPVNGNQGE